MGWKKRKPVQSVDTRIWLSSVYTHLAALVRYRFRGFHPTAPLAVEVLQSQENCLFVALATASF